MKKRMTEKRPKKLKLLAVLFFILISGLIFTSIGSQIKFFPQPSPAPVAPPDAVNSSFSMMTALSQSQNYSASRVSFVYENLSLTTGLNVFRFSVTDKHEHSAGFKLGIDCLILEKKRRILLTRDPEMFK